MTLGMLVIARGVTMTYSDAKPDPRRRRLRPTSPGSATGSVARHARCPFLLFIGIAALAWFTLSYTPFGRQVYAVGDNLEAARLSGIRPTGSSSASTSSAACAPRVSALIVVARLGAAEPTQGEGFELDAIAIVVIGGTSLFGGEGGIGGTLIGAGIVAASTTCSTCLASRRSRSRSSRA